MYYLRVKGTKSDQVVSSFAEWQKVEIKAPQDRKAALKLGLINLSLWIQSTFSLIFESMAISGT